TIVRRVIDEYRSAGKVVVVATNDAAEAAECDLACAVAPDRAAAS
ncbi:MAG: hypothetical protein HKN29_03505, partial [Rhodothermales bacterium]|nr:hypothetical protein [Rhodothermales bacterium]